jgi:hypothetical protein
METTLEQVNAALFAAQLHTRFKTQVNDSTPVELELAEVQEPGTTPKMELFCLHFRGPRSPRLPQQIYRLEHEKLGTLGIFLTAISADETGILYESVFHRFRKTAVST